MRNVVQQLGFNVCPPVPPIPRVCDDDGDGDDDNSEYDDDDGDDDDGDDDDDDDDDNNSSDRDNCEDDGGCMLMFHSKHDSSIEASSATFPHSAPLVTSRLRSPWGRENNV